MTETKIQSNNFEKQALYFDFQLYTSQTYTEL